MTVIGNPRSFHKKFKFTVEIDGDQSSCFTVPIGASL